MNEHKFVNTIGWMSLTEIIQSNIYIGIDGEFTIKMKIKEA